MSCSNPTDTSTWKNPIYNALGRPISVPCNICACCRADRIQHWSVRLDFEMLNKPCCFVCLTYDSNHLDYNTGYYEPTLKRSTFHKFIDKLHHMVDDKFTYFGCGEYGDEKGRPHYHVVFFGLDFVKYYHRISEIWKKGKVDVGPLVSGGVRYVLKYLEKQQFNKETVCNLYTDRGLDEPFVSMSPGIGSSVYLAHYDELLRGDPMVFGSRVVAAPSYWRRKFIHIDYETCRHSIALALAKAREIKRKALRMNMSVVDYVKWFNDNRERSLIHRMQQCGVPVYDKVVFGHRSVTIDRNALEKYVDIALSA